jgi:hypothetical protein
MRQGVSSGSDEQVGSSSQSPVTETNPDKVEMEDVVDGEGNVVMRSRTSGTTMTRRRRRWMCWTRMRRRWGRRRKRKVM